MNNLYEEKSKQLESLGFVVFEGALSQDVCNTLKTTIDSWFDNIANEENLVKDKRFKNFVVPDAISNDHFKNFKKVFESNHLLEFLKYHCKSNIMYLDHFDAHRNLSSGWHEDTNQKHFKIGNKHAGMSLFNDEYKVYRICFYLQDHDEDFCGLHVRPGTHKFEKSQHGFFNNPLSVGTKKGDMVIFDCRLSHKGITYNDSEMKKNDINRHSVFLCLGPEKNIFSETHRMGAVERQNKQIRKPSYKISKDLKTHLVTLGYSIFEDDSIFYK